MPSKRSKSKERERKRRCRERRSAEKEVIEKEKLKERMKKKRKEMTELEREEVKNEKREHMRKIRKTKASIGFRKETLISTLWKPGQLYGETELYKRTNEMERKRIKDKRAMFSKEEKEAENEEAKLRMQKLRGGQKGEEKQVQKEKDKERKRKFRENLTAEKRAAQNFKNKNRMEKCRMLKISVEENENLEYVPSDIVKRLNEVHRRNIEENCRVEENEGGERHESVEVCTCDIDIDCPYCLAQYEAEKGSYTVITKEEAARFDKEELDEYKIMKRNERKEKRKALMKKFKKPLPPLPSKELCEYEKIRKAFIAQRKQEWKIYEKQWEKDWQEKMKRVRSPSLPLSPSPSFPPLSPLLSPHSPLFSLSLSQEMMKRS